MSIRRRAITAATLLVTTALVGACSRTGGPASDVPSAAPATAYADAHDDRFELVLESTKVRWSAGEPIHLRATLRYIGSETGVDYAASGGGPIAFSLREIGGTRVVDYVRTADCRPYTIATDEPLVVPYQKSGGFSPGEPNEAFLRAFLADPVLSLPAGSWEVTADMELYVPTCERDTDVHLSAALTLIVE